MKTFKVTVYSVVAQLVLEVDADTEREALDDAHTMAEGRDGSAWSKAEVKTVAVLYDSTEAKGDESD